MNSDRMTFWFYYGPHIVASVRADRRTSHDTLRRMALESNDRISLCDLPHETPFERRHKIASAKIRVFPGGN